MEKRTAASGKEAMGWLLRGEETSTGSEAKLEREIAQSLAGSKPASKAPRKPAAVRKARPVATPRGSMTLAQFMSSLPPDLNMRGANSASRADVTKQIRANLAAALKAGVIPEGTKLSVTQDTSKGINVDITAWRGQVLSDAYLEHVMDPSVKWDPPYRGGRDDDEKDARLSRDINRTIAAITRIGNRHNFDESDSQSDYFHTGYSLRVGADGAVDAAETGAKLESNKELRALMDKAMVAAKAVGPAATKSICGSADLGRASTHCLEQLIRLAERAGGKPVEYDGRRRGWYPVDPAKSHLGTIKLGKTTYEVVTKEDADISLLGPRGGWSSLVRNQKKPDLWAHVGFGSGNTTVWYRRNADETFTQI